MVNLKEQLGSYTIVKATYLHLRKIGLVIGEQNRKYRRVAYKELYLHFELLNVETAGW